MRLLFPRYCVFFSVFSGSCVAEELELAPEPEGCAEEVDGAALLELEELEGCVVDPAPAEPLMLEELEPEGAALEPEGAELDEDEELSFFWMSTEVDEELEPDGALLGAAVVPEADEDEEPDGAAVVPAPDGELLVDELDAPAGARLSARSQPARTAAPNAMETASARVESFIWPPWLGYID